MARFSLYEARPWRKVKAGPGDEQWNRRVDPHRGTTDVGGFRLHYIDLGEGYPVVMIHGYADSTYTWHNNVDALLEAGFRVILVDQPAMGRSELPPRGYTFSMENQAGAIGTLLSGLGIDRYHVVGHSMGGGIALYLSLESGKVDRTAVVAPACYPPKRPPWFSRPGIEYLNYLFGGRWMIRVALWDLFGRKGRVEQKLVDEYVRSLNKPGYVKALALLARQYFSEEYREMSRRYRELADRLLIVWGDRDTWAPPKWGTRLHEAVEGSALHMFPGCGHLVHHQEAGRINTLLADFLSG